MLCDTVLFDSEGGGMGWVTSILFGVTWFNNAYSPIVKVKLFVSLTQWVRRVTLIDSVCFMLSFQTQF